MTFENNNELYNTLTIQSYLHMFFFGGFFFCNPHTIHNHTYICMIYTDTSNNNVKKRCQHETPEPHVYMYDITVLAFAAERWYDYNYSVQ